MMRPTNKLAKKYLYVKNGVIFKVLSNDSEDACAVELTETNAPYITINGNNAYFDCMEDGDVYVEEGEGEEAVKVFKKTIHGKDADVEMTFQDYYHDLCEKELSSLIMKNVFLTVVQFKNRLKNTSFPLYMIVGMKDETGKEYVVNGISKINLTEEKYNQLKEDEIKKQIMIAAKSVANEYGYEVTTEEIDIRRKS